jgi:hypothetical protein
MRHSAFMSHAVTHQMPRAAQIGECVCSGCGSPEVPGAWKDFLKPTTLRVLVAPSHSP